MDSLINDSENPLVKVVKQIVHKKEITYKFHLTFYYISFGILWLIFDSFISTGIYYNSSNAKTLSYTKTVTIGLNTCIFFIFLLTFSFFLWDNRHAKKIQLSQFQVDHIHIVYNIFISGCAFCLINLAIFASTYKTETIPYFLKESQEGNCWESMWRNSLTLSDIESPPHKTLDTLFNLNTTTNCNTSSIDVSILNTFLDDLLSLRTHNYLLTILLTNVIIHWGLRTLSFCLLSCRHYESSNVEPEHKKEIFVALKEFPHDVRNEFSKVLNWIEDSVKLVVDKGHKNNYFSIYKKEYAVLAGVIVISYTLVTHPLSQPTQQALSFMIKYGLNIYGGYYWKTVTYSVQYFIAITTLVLVAFHEWWMLFASVYDISRKLQITNLLRMKVMHSLVDLTEDYSYSTDVSPFSLLRRWLTQGRLHGWFILREYIRKNQVKASHFQSELGIVALLAIALILLTQVSVIYFIYGFFGNGAFGPWAIVSCPVLLLLSMNLVIFPLRVYRAQTFQKKFLHDISLEKELSIIENELTEETFTKFDDITSFSNDEKNSLLVNELSFLSNGSSALKVAELIDAVDEPYTLVGIPITINTIVSISSYITAVASSVTVAYLSSNV